MRQPITWSGLYDQAKIASGQPLAVQIAQKYAEYRASSTHGGPAEALAPFGQKAAHHCRREFLQILMPHIDQIGSKRAEMLVVQVQGRVT